MDKVVVAEYKEEDFAFDTISFSEDAFLSSDARDDEFVFVEKQELEDLVDEPKKEIKTLPGSTVNLADDELEKEVEVKETDWKTDRDVSKFMVYISQAYPAGIPSHDGGSIVAIERAINFLNKINKEISEAVRMDSENNLDVGELEKIRTNIYNDISVLKERIKKLEKKLKTKADDESSEIVKQSDFNKEATTAKIQLVMTPFERAITGIIVNAVVSAGHPMDEVYEHLKDKYELDDREELAILQILMDMGYPIFKDRGTFGESNTEGGQNRGVDFMRNYFA